MFLWERLVLMVPETPNTTDRATVHRDKRKPPESRIPDRARSLTVWTTLAVSFVLLIAWATYGVCEERGRIAAVRLAPDMTQLMIRFDGEIGKHSAFVMGKPCRLVLDFESTGLGKIPGKIAVHREPINEIRLGAVQSRSRVVVDFGDRPVPAFKIEQAGDVVTVRLSYGSAPGRTAGAAPRGSVSREAAPPRSVVTARDSLAPSKSMSPAPANHSASRMVVKRAGIADNLVFVELADRQDRKKVYRLVVDLDQDQMSVRQATLSDADANMKRFNLVAAGEDEPVTTEAPASPGSSAGPRKQATAASEPAETTPAQFKWGAQSTQSVIAPEPTESKRPGLRVKGFTLQERKPGNEG